MRFIIQSVVLLLAVTGTLAAVEKPNIVLIMADDMGYTDVGCYGSEIQTPVLDGLAANGLRFTQFYNTSRCCPTRASLLTGLYSHQAGIGLMTSDRGYDAYRGDLNRKCVTLAEVLRPAGYRNYMSGKWHVTRHTGPSADNSNWPLQRGFDCFYGTITGAGSFYDPATLCRGNTYITPENDSDYQPENFYYTDAISDNAASFVADHFRDHADEPFFLYVAYTSAHWPMHAPEAEISKYDGAYDRGYGPIREARYRKAIEQGVISDKWAMSAETVDWEEFAHKDWDVRCMEVYAAMVDRMDQGIGRIINQLKKADALDNTIVIYLQDNGGCAEGFGRNSNAHRKQDFDFKPLGRDGLQTKIWPPMQTRDGRWVGTGPETMPGAEDTFIAYGAGWANASNTPFRGYKHDGYEGGISTPLIVHWPAGIAQDMQGEIVKDPSHLIDLMPSLVEAADARYPKDFAGMAIQPMEGVSLIPTFSGTSITREAALGFEHHGNLALRDGRWKIVSSYRRDQPTMWELYDMEEDRTEQHDLASTHPEKLNDMVGKWEAWADRVGVQPWPFEKMPKSPATEKSTPRKVAKNVWIQESVTRFGDDFNKAHDFLVGGVSETGWDGFIGKDAGQTADRIAVADGKLFLQSTQGRYQEPWDPLGPLLFKIVRGDFRATVKVVDYESLSFNNCGIMARASVDDAGKGEDWISVDYFPIYGGIYARMADNHRRRETENNGQGKNADKYLQLERAGNQFFLRHSPDGVKWFELPNSPFQRNDLATIPLHVGLFQATYSENQGQVSFDDFVLEQIPPVKTSRLIAPEEGAVDQPRKLTLKWVPGHGVRHHDLYFGTSREQVASATRESHDIFEGRQSADVVELPMESLADGQTYFWRIDEITDAETHRGDVWSFTTYDRNLATFEEYETVEQLRSAWKTSGNGSANLTQEQPRSGKRALELKSRGDQTEIGFTFAANQDWYSSASNFRTLKLYLHGNAINRFDKLYVAIEDNDWQPNRSVVEFDADPDALTRSKWTTWSIDLRQFVENNPAVRLGHVRKLSVGVIGSGNVTFDDISIEYPSADDRPLVQPDRIVKAVPFDRIRVTGGLWRERMDVNRQVSLPHVWSRCESSIKGNGDPSKRLENFQKAGGLLEGPFTGTYFNDSDVYKIIEGTAYSLKNHPDEKLEGYTDKVIDWIAAAQWDDGYVYTFYSLPEKQPQRRWKNIGQHHELYCAGHLIEAAIAYRDATGKRQLFDVAVRFADLICDTFAPDKLEAAPGHQEIELALIKLYQATGEQRYKDTAQFFIDQRGQGSRRLYGTHSQDHIPFIRQETAVGHSVRAGYLFCAATDIARLDGNEDYANALFRLWDNIINTKTYLTGGIGQPGGPEGFTGDYQLGNNCYAETCSGIAFAFWNHRLHQTTGESKYADLVERTFLNNMLSSLSTEGDRHYYTNPLMTGGRERWEWPGHDCACCPSNLVRVISSISGYVYSHDEDTINVNQYMASTGTVSVGKNSITLTQKTNYPWNGQIAITVEPKVAAELEVKLRVPGWARNQPLPGNLYRYLDTKDEPVTLKINGADAPATIRNGYISIRRRWTAGDTITLILPMSVRRVIAHPKATADKGLVAIERGPIVYCAEFEDNNFPLAELNLSDSAEFETTFEPDFFNGVVTIKSGNAKFIPYYLYANRGQGWMRVWIPRQSP